MRKARMCTCTLLLLLLVGVPQYWYVGAFSFLHHASSESRSLGHLRRNVLVRISPSFRLSTSRSILAPSSGSFNLARSKRDCGSKRRRSITTLFGEKSSNGDGGDLNDDKANNDFTSSSLSSSNEKALEDEEICIETPSIKRIISFAVPAIGVYLCSPLLSTIDTSTVGIFCGTLQQAALNPAVTIIDYSARTMSFLYTGTTNLMATSKKNDSDSKEANLEAKDNLVGALQLALCVGSAMSILLLTTSRRLIVPLVGNASIDKEVLHAAWRYCAIRSIGFPAAAMIGTSQAACLGLQDNKTPFQVIVIAAVLNLLLDVALVGRKNAWIGGTAGAAWATTISQYVGLGLFLRKFATKNTAPTDRFGEKASSKKNVDRITKGFLAGKLKFGLPSKKTINNFQPYFVPVTTTQIGRCSMYIAMGHVVSSTFNVATLAAQQIITTIFYTLIPIGDSCSLTAQSFLPTIVAQEPTQKRSQSLNKTVKNIYIVAGFLGLLLSMIVACIPLFCPLLTADIAVMALVRTVVPILFALFFTHGFFCASEGILLGLRDLKFLGRIYALFFSVVPFLILRLKYAARAGADVRLVSVWNVFAGYQAFRISLFTARAYWLRHRLNRQDSKVENLLMD
jgi:Na+-driven multidrug efflux pump